MTTLLEERDVKNLKSLEKADDDEWCRGTWAYSLLYAFHMTDKEVQINWPKLYGRRCEDVRECAKELKRTKADQRQGVLSRFAKEHKEVRSAS